MEISDLFDQYSNKIAQIHLYQRAVKNIARNELVELEKYSESLEKRPNLKEFSSSYDNMFFRSARSGETLLFGQKISSFEDRQRAVVLHKNKQYKWLLAEAYEEFEDFMENAYAFAGHIDRNLWPLSDFGNISLSELGEKDFEWCVKQAKSKRDRPQSILNQFRSIFPDLSMLEVKNSLEVNLRLAVVLIEHLRHVIVHLGGVVIHKQEFIDNVLRKSGLYNNGKYDQKHVGFIKSFFGNGDYKNTVMLLEVRVSPEIPLDIHVDIFDVLSGFLMAYAHLIVECLQTHQKSITA